MIVRTTLEACSIHPATLTAIMVLATVSACHLSRRILFLALPFVMLEFMLLILLIMRLIPSTWFLSSEDPVIHILKFVCFFDSLFEHCAWYNPSDILLYDWVQSFEKLSYLLFLCINEFCSISGQPLQLGEILKNYHVSLHKLLELDGFLSLDMCGNIFITELLLEVLPCLGICHGSIF